MAEETAVAEEAPISKETPPFESSVSFQQEIGNEAEEAGAETLMEESPAFLQAEEVEALKPRKREEVPAAEKKVTSF